MAHAHHDHHDHAHDHHDHHDHGHGHRHDHHRHHAPVDMGRAFAIGVALNTLIVIAELVAGLLSSSLALLADAGHNLSDVLALLLAWGAAALAKRAPTEQRTYGLRKATILASLANAVVLLVAIGAIVSESVRRFAHPEAIVSGIVMATAGAGAVINTATALLFFRGRHELNARGAFLHMASDAAVSVAVVIGAGLIAVTHLNWIDPALSLAIAAVIVFGTWGLLRDSFDLAMDAAPREIDVGAVRDWLGSRPGVVEIHDLHIWAMSTTETALTAHLIRPANDDSDAFLHETCEALARRFNIGHATLQVETDATAGCRLAPAEVV
jgi:cobalt-zinc-cadmium efflux system protein